MIIPRRAGEARAEGGRQRIRGQTTIVISSRSSDKRQEEKVSRQRPSLARRAKKNPRWRVGLKGSQDGANGTGIEPHQLQRQGNQFIHALGHFRQH